MKSFRSKRLGLLKPKRHTNQSAKRHGFAIVDSGSKIRALFKNAEDAEGKWGWDLELVELKREHVLGDEIEYNEHGVET